MPYISHEKLAMRCDAMRCDTMRCDAKRCDAMRCDAKRCDAMPCDSKRCKAIKNDSEQKSVPIKMHINNEVANNIEEHPTDQSVQKQSHFTPSGSFTTLRPTATMRERASSSSEDELSGLSNQAAAAGLKETQPGSSPPSSTPDEQTSRPSSPRYVTATSESETEETEKVKTVSHFVFLRHF